MGLPKQMLNIRTLCPMLSSVATIWGWNEFHEKKNSPKSINISFETQRIENEQFHTKMLYCVTIWLNGHCSFDRSAPLDDAGRWSLDNDYPISSICGTLSQYLNGRSEDVTWGEIWRQQLYSKPCIFLSQQTVNGEGQMFCNKTNFQLRCIVINRMLRT